MASDSGLRFFEVIMQDIGTPWPLESYCDADPFNSLTPLIPLKQFDSGTFRSGVVQPGGLCAMRQQASQPDHQCDDACSFLKSLRQVFSPQ